LEDKWKVGGMEGWKKGIFEKVSLIRLWELRRLSSSSLEFQ